LKAIANFNNLSDYVVTVVIIQKIRIAFSKCEDRIKRIRKLDVCKPYVYRSLFQLFGGTNMQKFVKSSVTLVLSIVLLASVIFMSACSDSSNKPTASEKQATPVELTVWSVWPLTDKEFDEQFAAPVKKKYPHISLKFITGDIEKLISSGAQLDLLAVPAMYLSRYGELGLFYDMTPQIKKFGFDMNSIQEGGINAIRAYSKNGEIFAIPYTTIGYALYYNKSLFDQFGEPYPKDGMNWDEAIELGKRMTRMKDGAQYKGLMFQDVNNLASPLSLNYVDPKTGKPTLNNDGWKKALELMQSIISIQGNKPDNQKQRWFDNNEFIKNKQVAMYASVSGLITLFMQEPSLNWDMVTYPYYKDKPNTWGQPDGRAVFIASSSKQKDDAFKVIETMLSEEQQTAMSARGIMPSIKSKAAQDAFGKSLGASKINLQALFLHKPAPWRAISKYEQKAADIVALESTMLYEGVDVNTILRTADEKLADYITKNP
jgi:multiple sugar transport system substrate-binding protein